MTTTKTPPRTSLQQWIDDGGTIVLTDNTFEDLHDEDRPSYAAVAFKRDVIPLPGNETFGGFGDTLWMAIANLASAMSNMPHVGDQSILLADVDRVAFHMTTTGHSPESVEQIVWRMREIYTQLADLTADLSVFVRGAEQVDQTTRDKLISGCLVSAELLDVVFEELHEPWDDTTPK